MSRRHCPRQQQNHHTLCLRSTVRPPSTPVPRPAHTNADESNTIRLDTIRYDTISVRHLLWWMIQRLQSFSGLIFVDEIRRGRLVVWYYRLLGAKLGRDVFLNTVRVSKEASKQKKRSRKLRMNERINEKGWEEYIFFFNE